MKSKSFEIFVEEVGGKALDQGARALLFDYDGKCHCGCHKWSY